MRPLLHAWRRSSLAVSFLVAGCFKLSRETPPVQYFVLGGTTQPNGDRGSTAATPPAAPSTPNASGHSLGLRRLDLASYLAVPAIVTRRGANEIVVSEFHRWGEDLGEAINRVVALHLASAGGVRAVDVAPWAAGARHDFLVQLHVSRFEGIADAMATEGRSHLSADWDIIRPLGGRVLVRGRTDARGGPWRVGDYAGLVTSLDAALATLARDVSDCLARFPNDSTPPPRCESGRGEQR